MAEQTAHYYTRGDERLSISLQASVVLVMRAVVRTITPNGTIAIDSFAFPSFSVDRSSNVFTGDLRQGLIISISIDISTAGVARGRAYIRAAIEKRSDGSEKQWIIMAYLSSGIGLTWPPTVLEHSNSGMGWQRILVGTDPAVGVEISETVPTNALWRLRSIRYLLTTSAVAGDRESQIAIDDGANNVIVNPSASAQAATLLWGYTAFMAGSNPTVVSLQNVINIPEFVLPSGARIRTLTRNLDAGDNYTAPGLQVEEWLVL